MSSPVSTSTITATTLLTLMCVDASVSKNQSEYAHVLGSAWLFFSSGPNRVAHSRRTSMSICSRSNRLPSALSANSGSGDLQYWRPSLYEFSRCFCIIFCFMLSNLSLETFRPSRRCRASPCSWVRYWNTSSAADSSIWPSSSVINSTSSCIESNCVRVMAAPSGRAADSPHAAFGVTRSNTAATSCRFEARLFASNRGLPKRRVTTTAGCWRSRDVRYSDRASASSASLMAIAVPVIVS